ncbi:hypothetical protein GCM10017691_22140 [Pseudonocardia petroleophila]|uniref:DUF308 domain-containing protein n=1 Tax=Pseudonocardia petroleophila TaxID=37331 RepID=A0A7G7MGB2_9PSEU|nr:hypothetical protein [Pseudonocardia petroleophila]QNG51823.1 hypothetical protein H6H00_27620 [Pseudonocardia petroleophila]
MGGDPDERPHPDGGVDDFDAIVAGWRREGEVPRWPDEEPAADPPASPPPAPPAASVVRPPAAVAPEDEHFVPPEPPPLPRLAPPAAVGLVLLILGIVLVTAPGWVGVPETYGMPLGLLTLAAGLGWLVLRLWPSPPRPGEDDDGAVL